MLGRGMKLESIENIPGLRWRERLVEGADGMGVEVVLYQVDAFGVLVALLDEIAETLGIVMLGAMLRHRHMAPARKGLDHDKEVGGAVPFILIVPPLHVSGRWRQVLPHLGMEHDRFLVEADRRVALVVRHLVEHQHVFHGGHVLAAQRLGEAPVAMLPGLELVFFKSARMVSGEIVSTKPSSTALPASIRNVQWSCPSGTLLHAIAMRCACCCPVSAWR